LVRRLRHNVKGKPPRVDSRRYSLARKLLLTAAAIAAPFVVDVIMATRRATLVSAILAHASTPDETIVAAGAYVTTVDAQPACRGLATSAQCKEVLFHTRNYLGTTYSFRVRYVGGKSAAVERAGPWWIGQPLKPMKAGSNWDHP
jgi:hypothetical protein